MGTDLSATLFEARNYMPQQCFFFHATSKITRGNLILKFATGLIFMPGMVFVKIGMGTSKMSQAL